MKREISRIPYHVSLFLSDSAMSGLGMKVKRNKGGSHMFKVQTVSRLALFFMAMALRPCCRRGKGNAFRESHHREYFHRCRHRSHLGRWEAKLQGKGIPVFRRWSVAGGLGHQQSECEGDVYNLTDPAKLGGTYVAAEAGLTLAGGMGGMVLRNQDNVVLHLRSVSQGARLQLGTSGLIIKMK